MNGKNKAPLIARFGGISLCWKKQITLNEKPVQVYNTRTEILERLLRGCCELCGTDENCDVHHIRKLSDLSKPGRKEKPLWMKWMIARQRKTLVVCKPCHFNIHHGKVSLPRGDIHHWKAV